MTAFAPSEPERVVAWRVSQLQRHFGLMEVEARAIVGLGIDFYDLDRLAARGCDAMTAVRILAPADQVNHSIPTGGIR